MPDLSVVISERISIVKSSGIYGAPDLVVEIVSPGITNTKWDTTDKYKLYESSGVKEYWMIDYIEKRIYLYGLDGNRFIPLEVSNILQGIELTENPLFSGWLF